MMLTLSYPFSAAHFYRQKKWSKAKNKSVFGLCYSQFGHGHNYRLELEIDIGQHDIDDSIAQINRHVQSVVKTLDHVHLNFNIAYFKPIVPTTENISLYLRDQIKIPAPYCLSILRLFEMDSIFVELRL